MEVVIQLYEASAIIDVKDTQGFTPLMKASFGGHLDVVKFLVDIGADVNAKYQGVLTALHFAEVGDHQNVVHLLNSLMLVKVTQ